MVTPRFMPALNAATAGGQLPVADYLRLAVDTGYSWVELNGGQLPGLLALGPTAEHVLSEGNLRIASFFLPVNWREDEVRFSRDLEAFSQVLPALAALGADRCCTYLFPNLATPPDESRIWVGRRFRRVADLLAAHGMRFGLEFLGPAHFLAEPGHTFLYRMQEMLAFATSIGPNVGLLVDSLHWHCLGADVAALAAVPSDRLVYAHINDAPPGPLAEQRDDARLLPGEGVIDLTGFLRGLAQAGYAGPIGIEVDGLHLQADPPDRAAARALAAWNSLDAHAEHFGGLAHPSDITRSKEIASDR